MGIGLGMKLSMLSLITLMYTFHPLFFCSLIARLNFPTLSLSLAMKKQVVRVTEKEMKEKGERTMVVSQRGSWSRRP